MHWSTEGVPVPSWKVSMESGLEDRNNMNTIIFMFTILRRSQWSPA